MVADIMTLGTKEMVVTSSEIGYISPRLPQPSEAQKYLEL